MDRLARQLLHIPRESHSRMALALTLSLALHGLILALRWTPPEDTPPPSPILQVTLVNSRSATPALKPQAVAQANLAGGGERASGMASSPLPRTSDDDPNEMVLEALRRRQASLEAAQQRLLTQLEASADTVAAAQPAPDPQGDSAEPGRDRIDQDSAVINARIAALKARVAQYNALPKKTYTGPATQAADYAQYVEAWRKRIELIGTRHYPAQARGRIYGMLQLTVYIRRDGQLDHIQFDQPSTHAILNSAARRIVELAAPFDPLPPALAQHTDQLAITRTWHFTRAGIVSMEAP